MYSSYHALPVVFAVSEHSILLKLLVPKGQGLFLLLLYYPRCPEHISTDCRSGKENSSLENQALLVIQPNQQDLKKNIPCKLVQPLWKTVCRFLKIELPYDPAIPLLGIYPDKTLIQKDTCTPMFTATLFTIAKTWKQPKCPSTDEWIKKMWYVCMCIYVYVYTHTHTHTHTLEYYSAIKKNEILPFAAARMDLEIIILSEVSQKEKDKYHMISLTNTTWNLNIWRKWTYQWNRNIQT